jgi:outer membrane protein
MKLLKTALTSASLISALVATQAAAQEAGDAFVRIAASRTKLVDMGETFVNGVQDPKAGYTTRPAVHSTLTLGYFPIEHFALEASISTPMTTDNTPAGSLTGTPNLGDDEFITATLGASYHPLSGPIRPYIGGGYIRHQTTQTRDGLAVGLNVPSANGFYASGGVEADIGRGFALFVEGRKAWYSTNATGLLPLDATYTKFASVRGHAVLDPVTISVGISAKFGKSAAAAQHQNLSAPDKSKWIIKAGMTNLALADEVQLSVGGAKYAGAGLSTRAHPTPSVQFTRFLTDNFAANLTLGFPPEIAIYGAGSIGPVPKLGSVRYGPTALTLQYHPFRSGVIRPYVGVGASYMIVFGAKDGAFQGLHVDNDLGWAFEGGSEIMIREKVGLFVDVKKALLRPKTTGTFSGMPVVGQTRLDPWALTTGVAVHF